MKFQSPLKLPSHVPLAASLDSVVTINISGGRSQVMAAARIHGSFRAARLLILICFVFMAQRSWMLDDWGEHMRSDTRIRATR
jgi:hypothetical protein